MDGEFTYIKASSVYRQTKPYLKMAEVMKRRPVFEYQEVQGTLIGFYCPPYANGVSPPGYHIHFISADRKVGGHLLECRISRGQAGLDVIHGFQMVLPDSPEFYQVDLNDKSPAG
jgi:acetolactate decarboxylase